MAISILAIIGVLLSAYAVHVEKCLRKDESCKVACDINDRVSCTRAFGSRYGSLLGISNGKIGILFYLAVLVAATYEQWNLVFYLAVLSVIGSIGLAYILYARLQTFCLVCTTIYAVNIALLIFSSLAYF